jgi:hypothetical protein
MKDYIDKLREDFHRKKLNKFYLGGIQQYRFGDMFRKKQAPIIDDTGWDPIDPNANKKPAYTEPAENDWSQTNQDPSIEMKDPGTITLTPEERAEFDRVAAGGTPSPIKQINPIVKAGPPPDIVDDDAGWDPIDPNANKKPAYTEPAENDWSDASRKKAEEYNKSLGIETKDPGTITLTPEEKKEFDENQKDFEEKRQKKLEKAKRKAQGLPAQPQGFFIPPNGDLTTNLYNLGRAIGEKKGTPGRGLAITANAGAATLEGFRSFMGGKSFQEMQNKTDQYNADQLIAARKKYESNPQYKNANYTGGQSEGRNGGKFGYFEDGGEQMDPRQAQMMQQQGQQEQMDPRQAQMMQQEGQQQMDPRQQQMMQQQQETQMTEQESAAYQQIAEKLVNSFETIEEIANYLQENQVDEVAYEAILNFAEDMLESRDESAEDNEEATEESQEGEGEEMRKGGKKFNKKVGEYIEFEYGGKTYKGTIKSIKNGQIFLK